MYILKQIRENSVTNVQKLTLKKLTHWGKIERKCDNLPQSTRIVSTRTSYNCPHTIVSVVLIVRLVPGPSNIKHANKANLTIRKLLNKTSQSKWCWSCIFSFGHEVTQSPHHLIWSVPVEAVLWSVKFAETQGKVTRLSRLQCWISRRFHENDKTCRFAVS